MTAAATSPLQDWVGRTESHSDVVALTPIAALSATLDRDDPLPQPGDALPPLWHWLYFLTIRRASELGRDGHPARGGFLPPVALPRRMWAGGRLQFHHPLRAGEEISRESRIVNVTEKTGRTGMLVFVLVRHEIRNAAGVAITEEHDIVYRDDPKPDDPKPAPRAAPIEPAWTREIVPDETLLFRYSALTFNGHRIHYDYRYVTEVEGYDGLVVHGPLIATLLLDLVRRQRPEEQVARFEFRALRPVTVTGVPLTFCGQPEADGKTVKLWTRDHAGWLTMEGTATLAADSTISNSTEHKVSWKDNLIPKSLQNAVSSGVKTNEVLINNLPKIREFFMSKVGPAMINVAKDEEKMTALSKSVYGLLPTVVRLAVNEGAFVQFCLTHRDKLVARPSSETH